PFDHCFTPSANGIEARPQPMKMSGHGGSIGSEPTESAWRGAGTKPAGNQDQGVRRPTRLVTSCTGARRPMASPTPSAWFSIPARPSLTTQILRGSAGWKPTLLIGPAPPDPGSEVLPLDDFVRLGPARSHDLDDVAFLLADQRARDRGGHGDFAGLHVGFVLADDLI